MADCGSGTGALSVPLSILYPNKKVVSIEPSKAKAAQLKETISSLNLKNIRVVESMLEELNPGDFREVDLVTGVGIPDQLINDAIKAFSKTGAKCLFYKGQFTEKQAITLVG